ncbi:hypothetical protein GEMRC1_008532 [Eukaryota sp. GEM-RC1]
MQSTGLPGGSISRNHDEPDVKEAVEFAMEHLNLMSNSLNPHILDSVVDASSQVVAGTNYHLTLKTTRGTASECHKFQVFKSLTGAMELTNHQVVF